VRDSCQSVLGSGIACSLLILLLELHGRAGGTGGYLRLVPVPVVLQSVQDVLRIRVDQVRPGLPQRVHDVVDEANLGDLIMMITIIMMMIITMIILIMTITITIIPEKQE
jgi:hypothetical protein